MRILKTETVFHALAVAVLLRGLINGSINETTVAIATSVMALGRAMPTEKVDKLLDIPLGTSPHEAGDRPPNE
jgi:hypothetical protein